MRRRLQKHNQNEATVPNGPVAHCAPRKTAPYQIDVRFPTVTSPITEAEGATKTPWPKTGLLSNKGINLRCRDTVGVKKNNADCGVKALKGKHGQARRSQYSALVV